MFSVIRQPLLTITSMLFLLGSFMLPIQNTEAVTLSNSFPRIGNFYLRSGTDITNQTIPLLARYDLLVLPAETQIQNPNLFSKLRTANPNIIILAYVPSTSFNHYFWKDSLHQKLLRGIQNEWWLVSSSGTRISIWPGTEALNLTTPWSNHLARYAAEDILTTGLWDGIMFDEIDACASCKNNGNIDLDRNGQRDNPSTADSQWQAGVVTLLQETRRLAGPNTIILINGNSAPAYQSYVNGRIFESFPTPWEKSGLWQELMESAKNLFTLVRQPQLFFFDSDTNNAGQQKHNDLRFNLGSALLAGAFFGYDFGTEDHGQLWWFDEYNVFLGQPTGAASNIKNPEQNIFTPSVWRRDFEKGIVLVNSSEQTERVRLGEDFEKIHGTQDPITNDGAIVSRITVPKEDGLILMRVTEEVRSTSFTNGAFTRIFNRDGSTARTGFFLFDARFEGGKNVLRDDLDDDGRIEALTTQDGRVKVFRPDGSLRASFAPYGEDYHGEITIAVGDLNGNKYKEIITGTGFGGGPHIRIWNADGRLLHPGFFAYDPKLRGGVDVGVGDLDGDGRGEIITGVGRGEKPLVRVWKNDGTLQNEFLAYHPGFRGGINVDAGDVDGDGLEEIITGANRGGGPHVRIFQGNGASLGRGFFAYESFRRDGVQVGVYDIDGNGVAEILALTTSVFP